MIRLETVSADKGFFKGEHAMKPEARLRQESTLNNRPRDSGIYVFLCNSSTFVIQIDTGRKKLD